MNSFGISILLMIAITGITANLISNSESGGNLIDSDAVSHSLEKRPFCNAFTGCGKKRSFNAENRDKDFDEPLAQLSRRIIQEARQWELLQQKLSNNEIQRSRSPLFDYLSVRKRRSIESSQENI